MLLQRLADDPSPVGSVTIRGGPGASAAIAKTATDAGAKC